MNLEEEIRMLESSTRSTGPRTMAFAGGKGGVGTSVLALNLALLLAKSGKRVLLWDGVLGLANLTVLVGRTPRKDIGDVLAGQATLADIVIGIYGVDLIPAAAGIPEMANLSTEALEELLGKIREFRKGYDFLIIDVGSGISYTTLTLVEFADETVVVTRPEPTALADAYALIKIVAQDQPAYPLHLLVNMARDAEQAEKVYRSFTQILMKFIEYRPGYAGFIANDPNVAHSVVYQIPFVLRAPWSRATKCLLSVAEKLAPMEKARPLTFWERVARGLQQ